MYSLFIACPRMFSMIAESKDIQSRINIKILFQFLHRLTSSRGWRPKWPFLQVIDLKVLYIDESDRRVYIFPPPYKMRIFSLFMNDFNDYCVFGYSIKHIDNEIFSQFLRRLSSSRSRRPEWPFLQVIDLKVLYIDESDRRVYIFPPPYKITNIFIYYEWLQWSLCLGKFNQTYRLWNSFSVSTKVTEQQKSQTQVTISSGNWP